MSKTLTKIVSPLIKPIPWLTTVTIVVLRSSSGIETIRERVPTKPIRIEIIIISSISLVIIKILIISLSVHCFVPILVSIVDQRSISGMNEISAISSTIIGDW